VGAPAKEGAGGEPVRGEDPVRIRERPDPGERGGSAGVRWSGDRGGKPEPPRGNGAGRRSWGAGRPGGPICLAGWQTGPRARRRRSDRSRGVTGPVGSRRTVRLFRMLSGG